MKHILSLFFDNQFIRYIVAGAIATCIDWGFFYGLVNITHVRYPLALIISFTLGSLTNYVLNKLFTFHCPSKKIAGQAALHLSISAFSLSLSIGMMMFWVEFFKLDPMMGRIITTIIMLILNFIMHKYITFNKEFFK